MTSRFSSALPPSAPRSPRARANAVGTNVLLGVLGALGLAAWAGCGSGTEGRYYCDGGGCFQCDAYGCSAVSAPTHASCSGKASCATGSVCTTTGCTTACASDASCPKGETCQTGFCSAPGTAPGTAKECTTKADCGGGAGNICVSGSCATCGGTSGPCPCTAAADCASGLTCVASACTPTADTCKFSSECGDNRVCADGQCLTSCATAACTAGFTCAKTVCQPISTTSGGGTTSPGADGGSSTPACTADPQCTSPDAPNCAGGACTKACTGDATCGDGKFCNQGACVVDTRPKPNCTSDDQCGGTAANPKKCLDGFCKYSCTTDQYCKTIDSRIGFCAADAVCRNAAEANPACTGPGQCPNGQSCIDNACQ